MGTNDIVKELELNYGYEFSKDTHQFSWLHNLIGDVARVVGKNTEVVETPLRYFIIFYRSKDSCGHTHYSNNEYPAYSFLCSELGKQGIKNAIITGINEVTKEDSERFSS